ncbi:MAG: ATP-dependent metallopeptidase FtsH/Yme1/Tma family protein [Geobacter sp.]|nr:MAG: ATP-dependent metallopeptidase FtsH/Yme1/Tma family protein [Geobacter sp.]
MAQSIWKPLLALIAFVVLLNIVYPLVTQKGQLEKAEIPYSQFKDELARDNVKEITIKGSHLNGVFKAKVLPLQNVKKENQTKETTNFFTILPDIKDDALMADLQAKKVVVKAISTESSPFTTALLYLIPWILIIGVWVFFARSMKGQGPGTMMGGFAKSGAKLHNTQKGTVTFADVAGMEEVKQELREVVEYLKEPKKFEKIGGKVPRGILLVGPPGTGKTLLARAVAGEAGVAFFSISASQFIEMFVGVGASRVRDLFVEARKQAPSIIFIDELDAVGRSRGAGFGGGHDEREQTLNQLLSEMDGFDSHEEVIVLAATNRPDVLDPALLRPGRFDRRVVIERPDWRDRESILKVHTRKTPLSADVDLAVIAKGTPGMTGADLENLVNEAAILAARENSETVTMKYLELAKDKVLMGGERKLYLSDLEKRITAFHESGHVLVAKLLPGTDPVHKVTIIPRGMALGVTQQLPEDDRHHYPKSYLMNRLSVVLGGRVAERLVFNDISTGAQSDLKIVTELAEKMVCQWGMSDKIGPVTFSRGEEHPFLGMKLAQEKTFSEEMAWLIDQEIAVVIKDAEDKAMKILASNRNLLEALAMALLEEETLDSARIDSVLANA